MVKILMKKLWKTQFYAQQYPDEVNFKSQFLMCAVHADTLSRKCT